MKRSTVAIVALSTGLFITSMSLATKDNNEVKGVNLSNITTAEAATYNTEQDVTSYLQLSELGTSISGTLKYVKGKITNNSNITIDSIGELLIFDSQGSLHTSKYLEVKLQPHQSMYFNELAGNNVPVLKNVKLQGFEQ
jgi:hypothetical protein